jgi:hypothetical protein
LIIVADGYYAGGRRLDMKVQFEFTPNDLIDVHNRMVARSKVWRSTRLKGLLATALLVWMVIFLLLHRTPLLGVIIGLFAAALAALLFPVMQKREVEKHLRRLSTEIFGNTKSVLCEVELRPEGVWVRQMNNQILYEWPSVEEVEETPDSVDIFNRNGSGLVVRNRAFSSAEERSRFIRLAKAGVGLTQNPALINPSASNQNSI